MTHQGIQYVALLLVFGLWLVLLSGLEVLFVLCISCDVSQSQTAVSSLSPRVLRQLRFFKRVVVEPFFYQHRKFQEHVPLFFSAGLLGQAITFSYYKQKEREREKKNRS